MPTTITSAGITFNDATTLTSATIPANAVGATQIANGSVTAAKLGTAEQKQIAKAWVNFNGTGTIGTNQTIRSSYNVSSVTKNGTGDYTINFSTPMANANYAVVVSSNNNGASITASRAEAMADCIINLSTSSFGYNHREGSGGNLFDVGQSMITIFGN